MSGVGIYNWGQTGAILEKPGIYAWYYQPKLSQKDVETFIVNINTLKNSGEQLEAHKVAEKFLENHIYRFFKEDPYQAEIRGPLKPTFFGAIQHQSAVSENLVKRLLEKPERIVSIKSTLELTAPHFASPIYIGMSDGLRTRIAKHKFLIERYRKHYSANESVDELANDRDAGFAMRVAQRGIPPELLFVATCVVQDDNGINVDMENLLNRIYYPILGRN